MFHRIDVPGGFAHEDFDKPSITRCISDVPVVYRWNLSLTSSPVLSRFAGKIVCFIKEVLQEESLVAFWFGLIVVYTVVRKLALNSAFAYAYGKRLIKLIKGNNFV